MLQHNSNELLHPLGCFLIAVIKLPILAERGGQYHYGFNVSVHHDFRLIAGKEAQFGG